MENTPVNKVKYLSQEFDPRSPTTDFDRTPITINESSSISSPSSQDMSFKSVHETSYDSFDISRDDPSPVVSSLSLDVESLCNIDADNECDKEVLPTATKAIQEESPLLTKDVSNIPLSTSQVDTSDSVSPSPTLAAKKIIFSPSMNNAPHMSFSPLAQNKRNSSFTCHVDEEEVSVQQPLKARSPRTPLASINQSDSPLNILRAKQWKDFHEEREKLGLAKPDNALPPFKATPSSVPAKIPMKRRPLE